MDNIDPFQTDNEKISTTAPIANHMPAQNRASHFIAGFFLPYPFYLALLLLFQIGSCEIVDGFSMALLMLMVGGIVLPFIHLINLASGFFFRKRDSKTIKKAYIFMIFTLLFVIALLGLTPLFLDISSNSCDINWH